MIESEWNSLRFFKRSEAWGEPDRMSFELLKELELFRKTLMQRIVVSCGTQGMHQKESLHYEGRAVDIVFPDRLLHTPDTDNSLFDYALKAMRLGFTGIGIYPEWRSDEKKVGGLHLEVSSQGSPRKFWIGVGISKTNTTYIGVSAKNLRNYGIV